MKPFEYVKIQKPGKSVFDLSEERKFTMDMGKLVPVYLKEVIPGDEFKVSLEALVRFMPLVAPIMHRINVYVHWFYVPNRIIWTEWEDFITGGRLGTTAPNFPKITGTHDQFWDHCGALGSLYDYIGAPSQQIVNGLTNPHPSISQLPFRAYQTIYNEYYRDQNLEEELIVPTNSTDIAANHASAAILLTLRQRAWQKDYFTSSLPFAQRGSNVLIPVANGTIQGVTTWLTEAGLQPTSGTTNIGGGKLRDVANQNIKPNITPEGSTSSMQITELRRAFALQRFLEKMGRGGGRYVEFLLHIFGVKSSDARIQRPEYLGGGKIPVQISEVLQNSQTETTPQGTMTGHAITAGTVNGFRKYCEEHGHIIGIMSILPRTSYYQGIPKQLTKFDRFEYYTPDFATIGEQEVRSKELYVNLDSLAIHDQTFGYQERYAEYRTGIDSLQGEFRTTLEFWHLGRKFSARPSLNNTFVKSDPATRIYAVSAGTNKVIVNTYARVTAIRPIIKHGTPL